MLSKELSDSVLTVGCAFHPPRGGVAQVLYNYERYVFPHFKYVVNSGGENKFVKLGRAVGALWQMFFRLAFDRRIRIVHIHTASYNSFRRSMYFVGLGKLFGKKIILHIHGGGFREFYATNPKKIAKRLDRCDTLVVLSETWKRWFEGILPEKKIEVVGNIVPKPTNIEKMRVDNRLHLLFLGLITEEKGIFDLLDVLEKNKSVFAGRVCLHIGGNGKVDKLQRILEEKGLQDMVTYEGWVDEEKKSYLFSLSDAFVLPSYTEGLPVSILEAMSYGLPIIATRVGGIPELVLDNENGILFEAGNKEEMLESIRVFVDNDELRHDMGNNSKVKSETFLPDHIASLLFKVYNNI